MDRRQRSGNHTRRQRGAAMVEFAVVALLYFILIFGIIEFVLAVYHWSQVVKGAREGVRYSIVNDPVCDLFGTGNGGVCDGSPSILACPGGGAVVSSCSSGTVDCNNLLNQIQAGGRQDIENANIVITYACSGLDLSGGTPIPAVTVTIQNVVHNLVVPNLLGFDPTWTIPAVRVTKTAEDFCTAATSGSTPNC